MVHRKLDPYSRARDAARDRERADPRNRRLHDARSLIDYLPAALLYPLQAETLLATLGFTLGLWLGGASVFGLAFLLLVAGGLVSYWLEIVLASANGFGAPPRFGAAMFGRLPTAFQALLPLVALALLVDYGRSGAMPWLEWSALLLGAALLPAWMVLLAIEGSLLAALDPRRWTPFVSGGGVAYWGVAALTGWQLSALAGGSGGDGDAIDVIASVARYSAILATAVMVFAAFAGAHLLGAMVFLRREALGFKPLLEGRSAAEDEIESLQESVARLLKLADEEEHHERHAAAARLLATEPIGSHAPRPWLEELFEGACRRPKPYFAEAAGQRLVAHLCKTQQWNRALEVVVHAAQRWHKFAPASAEDRVKLAEHALTRGDVLAFRQLTQAGEPLGDAPQSVDLAFLAARWLNERDNDPAAARAALAPLLARREHRAHPRIAAYAAAIGG